MNKSFMQIDDNFGVVSDENGNISLVRSENNEIQSEDTSNELEYLIDRFIDIDKRYNDNKKKIKYNELCNMILLIIQLLVYIIAPILFKGSGLVTGLIISCITFNAISVGLFITRRKRHSEVEKLLNELKCLEEQIPMVSKELEKMKEKNLEDRENVEYKDEIQKISVINNNSNNKVKVRRLVRNNDKNR